MDRKISTEFAKQRRNKKIIKIVMSVVVSITIFIVIINLTKPSINLEDVKISTATRDNLSVSITARGKVIPFYQEVITSPISSKIVNVLKKAGDKVSIGDPILELDLESFSAEVMEQNEELQLKRLKLEQFKVATISGLNETQLQINIDSMKLQRMAVQLINEKYLDSIGASTSDKVKQIELDYKIQMMQFKQFKEKYLNQKKNSEIEIKSMELDYKTAVNNTSLLNKKMQEAYIRSTSTATLTWVNDEIGANISVGANLAIISDLEKYKIEGSLSDSYSDKISSGDKVAIKLVGETISGVVGNVSPSVSEGAIKFNVSINNSSHSKLRSGLTVDLYIINSVKDNVLCIDNYSYYVGAGEYDLWVVNGNKILKRKVNLGESSYDKVEVISGLEEGEQVIISDMSKFNDRNEITLK